MRTLFIFILVLGCASNCFAGRKFNGTSDVITVPNSLITSTNIDDTLTGWKPVCILPDCNPGGVGIPTATAQTINHVSPSLDGESMLVSITGPAFTNALWVYLAGPQDDTVTQSFDVHIFLSANSAALGSLELDQFNFDRTHMIEFMYGSQCNQVNGLWQIWNQLTTAWIDTAVVCSLSSSAWHEIKETVHRIPGDPTICSGQACQCYDTLTIDGVAHALNICEPSGPLPSDFASEVGFQTQLDIGGAGSGGSPITENIDEATFTADATGFDLTSAMTMAVWFNPTIIPNTEADFISKWSPAFQFLLNISESTKGQIGVAYNAGGIKNYFCGSTLTVPNVWHHAASTYDQAGGVTAIYLDGNQCSFIAASAPITTNSNSMFFGARDATISQPFPGILAEVGIWNVVLTNAEILSLGRGVPPREVRRSALVGYWPLYGAASPEPDFSGLGANGVLTGTTTANHAPVTQ